MSDRGEALPVAFEHARRWLDSLEDRPVPPQAQVEELVERLGTDLPDGPQDAAAVVEHLATALEPGLTAMPSGRFYGMVIGGTHPAALAADWLVSAWDQNAGLARVTPATTAAEQVAGDWLLDLLGLPAGSAVGFVTGGTMANFTGLAAGRDEVLRRAGWDVAARGLVGSPGVRVLVGDERHDTVDLALRYLGLGAPEPVRGRRTGPHRPAGPGRARSGETTGRRWSASRPATSTPARSTRSRRRSPRPTRPGRGSTSTVRSGCSPRPRRRYRHLTAGAEAADSWATDAHKTLNVPYDCGIAIVADPAALKAAMGMHGDYLIQDAAGDPLEKVPELSRRARGLRCTPCWPRSGGPAWPTWSSGWRPRRGVRAGIADFPGVEVLNDVVFTQVCVSFGDDERTRAVVARAAGGRRGVDERLGLARPGGAAHLGEQLVDLAK